jgi:hypothetical protein
MRLRTDCRQARSNVAFWCNEMTSAWPVIPPQSTVWPDEPPVRLSCLLQVPTIAENPASTNPKYRY